ncbi:MFS transporter [Exiguobacterium sp. RIT452]|uniref:MFS transporter n=1 Tax=Exiguobacterium sp. RIT452 TaxID=2315552 RepID=UPI001F2F73B6|nr:MFS transporter [Exiguobacterium sp. RIT452]
MTRASILLASFGVSQFGDFIYLVAINVYLYQLTGSAAAVAGLWIIGPIAALFMKFWAGSVIDRVDVRRWLIGTDIVRAVLVALLPLLSTLPLIYLTLFALALVKAFFEPSATTYLTQVVPETGRKSFNAYRSLITSSAFLIGPALAGLLLLVATPGVAIWINAMSFLVSGLLLLTLPSVPRASAVPRLQLADLATDWRTVSRFSRTERFVSLIYILGLLTMSLALALDAQEVVFLQTAVGLTTTDYGLLISITGIGSVLGGLTVARFANRLSLKTLLVSGYLFVALGYLIYATADSFLIVTIGFLLLGFFNAFAGTGFLTFYQNNVPGELIGRFTSLYGLGQSVVQIVFILAIGFTGDLFPLRFSIVSAAVLLAVLSLVLMVSVLRPNKRAFFREDQTTKQIS